MFSCDITRHAFTYRHTPFAKKFTLPAVLRANTAIGQGAANVVFADSGTVTMRLPPISRPAEYALTTRER